MREWKSKLTEAEKTVMQEIVDQIPQVLGLRDRIEDIMDKMAAGGKPPKFKYIIVSDGDVQGTNDEEKMLEYAAVDDNVVIDVVGNDWILDGSGETSTITELK